MLSRAHVRRHSAFLERVYRAANTKAVRRLLASAQHFQLRSLLLSLAAVALKQVPAPDAVQSVFYHSRKKRLLQQVLGSRAKLRRFLAQSPAQEWRRVLLELAPLLRPSLSVLFSSAS